MKCRTLEKLNHSLKQIKYRYNPHEVGFDLICVLSYSNYKFKNNINTIHYKYTFPKLNIEIILQNVIRIYVQIYKL